MAIHDATIAVDFDGTVVTHAYPEIGEDAGAAPVLKELTDNGCRLILYSMRHGKLLDRAVEWFRVRGIPLYAVNENPSQKRWTSSPKIHADLYIDVLQSGMSAVGSYDGERNTSRSAVVRTKTPRARVGTGRFRGLTRRGRVGGRRRTDQTGINKKT